MYRVAEYFVEKKGPRQSGKRDLSFAPRDQVSSVPGKTQYSTRELPPSPLQIQHCLSPPAHIAASPQHPTSTQLSPLRMRCVLLTFAFLLLAGTVLAKRRQRIINGTEPRLYEFPSMVSIWLNCRHDCGGTLIDEDTVLTAAHCFYLNSPQNLTVKINAHDFNRPTPRERVVKVRQVRSCVILFINSRFPGYRL